MPDRTARAHARRRRAQDAGPGQRQVAVIGSGYVGTVVAACLSHLGNQVVCVETDTDKLATLEAGRAPFYEQGLDELLSAGAADGRLSFTSDMKEAMMRSDIVFICVGTPEGSDHRPDMGAVVEVAASIAANIEHPHILINKSTVPIGSGRWLSSVIADVARDQEVESLIRVVSNPEFLREGTAVSDYLHPDRVVVGADDFGALEEVVQLYRPILEQSFPGAGNRSPVPVLRTDLITAEMIKYAANSFLATKISFANEMARLCDLVGADIRTVVAGMGLDQRIGPQFLGAGLGFGGSCLRKDVMAMIATASDYGHHAPLLQAVMDINQGQRQLVVEKLLRHLKNLRGARVALLGLAYKPGTDDLRDAPALDISRSLADRGAFVSAYDPVVSQLPVGLPVRLCPDPYAAVHGADAVVVVTEWPQFLDLDFARLRADARGDLLLDGRNCLRPDIVEAAGFVYQGIGLQRPVHALGAPADADGASVGRPERV